MEPEHFLLKHAVSIPNISEADLRSIRIPINSSYMTKTCPNHGEDDDSFESSINATCGWSNSFLT